MQASLGVNISIFLVLVLGHNVLSQRTITKLSLQQSGYTNTSTYYNGFYSNIGAVDEDAFEGLVGMVTIDISFNVIKTLGT